MISGIRLIVSFLIIIGIISCQNSNNVGQPQKLSQDQVTEKLVEANKNAIEIENKQIDTLIFRSGWEMQATPTGLRYEILKKGNGTKTAFGKIARIKYEVKLISGKSIYSSVKTGPKDFKIGSGGVESGLEEGILLLNVGDSARFILPSYLAHGLSGDQNLIPPKSTLIYTLKLIEIK